MHVGATLPRSRSHDHGRSVAGSLGSALRPASAALVAAAGFAAALVFAGAVRRVAVEGSSMLPALEPGDRLLVVRLPSWWRLQPGQVVAVADPRGDDRVLVKRVTGADPGRLGALTVEGDNLVASTDSRSFGPVPRRAVFGVAWYRYAPAHRAGRLGRHRPPGPRPDGPNGVG